MTVHVMFRPATPGEAPRATLDPLDTGPVPMPKRTLLSRMALLGTTLGEFRAERVRVRRERGKGSLSGRAFAGHLAGILLAAGATMTLGHAALADAAPEQAPWDVVAAAPPAPAPAPPPKAPVAPGRESVAVVDLGGQVPVQRLRPAKEVLFDGPFEQDAAGGLWVAKGTFELDERVQVVADEVLEVVVRDDLEEGQRYLRLKDGSLVKGWPELLEQLEAVRYRADYAKSSGRGKAADAPETDGIELTEAQRKARDEAAMRALVETGFMLPVGALKPATK